jgi:uncharacterized small protein (DUF1192 family)
LDGRKDHDLKDLENIDGMIVQIKDLKTKISTLDDEVTRLQAEEKIK